MKKPPWILGQNFTQTKSTVGVKCFVFLVCLSELDAGDRRGGRGGRHLHHHTEEGAASPVGQQRAAMAGRGHGLRPEPLRNLQGADHQSRHSGEAGGVHGVGVQGQRLHLRHHLPLYLPILRHHQAGARSPAQQVRWHQTTHQVEKQICAFSRLFWFKFLIRNECDYIRSCV